MTRREGANHSLRVNGKPEKIRIEVNAVERSARERGRAGNRLDLLPDAAGATTLEGSYSRPQIKTPVAQTIFLLRLLYPLLSTYDSSFFLFYDYYCFFLFLLFFFLLALLYFLFFSFLLPLHTIFISFFSFASNRISSSVLTPFAFSFSSD